MMYDDSEYAHSRLANTFVRHKGKAVYVRRVRDNFVCNLYSYGEGGREYDVKLEELDLSSPPLGLVNVGDTCHYVTRRPMRNDWRQGVRSSNTTWRQGRSVENEFLSRCIDGKFPTKSTALRRLREGHRQVAISRDFYLTKSGSRVMLNYKWYGEVGQMTTRSLNFSEKWEHLKEVFNRSMA